MKLISLYIIATVFALSGRSQGKQDIIKDIRQEFQGINTEKNLKVHSLDAEEFLENAPDRGAELKAYLKKDSIVKITEWIGLSYANRTREFYFKNQKLIFVYEKFDSFITEKSDSLDFSKARKVFEGRYYFKNDKLIDEKLWGKKPMGGEKTTASDLLSDAKEYVGLFAEKK